MLERVDAALFNNGLHLVENVLVPAGDGHVIGDVGANLIARLSVPIINRIEQTAVFAGQTKINQQKLLFLTKQNKPSKRQRLTLNIKPLKLTESILPIEKLVIQKIKRLYYYMVFLLLLINIEPF